MADIEQDIASVIDRLKGRQSELATQWGIITNVIETLEKSLGDLESLPSPRDDGHIADFQTKLGDDLVLIEKYPHHGHGSSSSGERDPRLTDPVTYFNLSQSQAVIQLMRINKRPLQMLEILSILKEANYPIKAKVPYQSFFSMMTRDKAFVKSGKLWGLRESSEGGAGGGNNPLPAARRRVRRINPFSAMESDSGAGRDGETPPTPSSDDATTN
jgi:hypothetical protein